MGEKLFLKGDKCNSPVCPFIKKSYAPGETGSKSYGRKKSDFYTQLVEKQKVRAIYGLTEKQILASFKKARSADGQTGAKLISIFERRLDNVLLRSGMAKSCDEAKQKIVHGKIFLNGKKIGIPSYQVNVGDLISEKSNKSVEKRKIQSTWLKLRTSGEIEVSKLPTKEDIPSQINEQLIVEYYSR